MVSLPDISLAQGIDATPKRSRKEWMALLSLTVRPEYIYSNSDPKSASLHVNDATYLTTHKIIASLTKRLPQDRMRSWFP